MSDGNQKIITVDLDRCEGHGRCYAVAPKMMRPCDDYGHAEFYGQLIDPSDLDLMALAKQTVNSCPEEALAFAEGSAGSLKPTAHTTDGDR